MPVHPQKFANLRTIFPSDFIWTKMKFYIANWKFLILKLLLASWMIYEWRHSICKFARTCCDWFYIGWYWSSYPSWRVPEKQGKLICCHFHCTAQLTSKSCCEQFIVATRIPLIAFWISCIKCKNLLSFKKETEIKEDNSLKLHFKEGKGLKIFQPSEYLFCRIQSKSKYSLLWLLMFDWSFDLGCP